MKIILSLAVILALAATDKSHAAPLAADPVDSYRLPDIIHPSNYNLSLTAYLADKPADKRFSFEGVVTITLSTKQENVKEIVLHQKELAIDNSKTKLLLGGAGEPLKIQAPKINETTNVFKIPLDAALEKDKNYELTFVFTGKMSEDMRGFYKSSHINKNNEEIWIGATQFQTNHARRAFPCFDEPKFKATFSVSINHEKVYSSVFSNMDILESKPADDRVITSFKQTPVMSTYLLAFIISDFKERINDDKTFGVIASPEFEEQTKYSFDEGQKLLAKMDEFTGLPYNQLGNEKMHMAAIPDFSAGAMENWGLLTYRERGLLYDSAETIDSAQQYIDLIIAHEQAHMWFGDYVTCDWWNVAWLNEGFARYFQYFTTHELHPEWELDKQFVVDQIHSVFNMDSLGNTHPMTDKDINTPDDLAKMFDSISYNKGGAVIRMFKHSMGADNFKTALSKYLKLREYKTTEPKHLFDALKTEWKEQPINVIDYFTEWTEQVGYPVVNVELSDDGKTIELTQKRFLLENDAGDDTLLYTIPFTYTTNKETKFEPNQITFLTKSKDVQKIDLKEPVEWVIGNIQQIGYFRVNYQEKMWHKLHHALLEDKYGKIHELNRAHLVDDLFNFGRSGALKYDLVFSVLDYLRNETNYLPWTAAFNGFSYLSTRLGAEHKGVLGNLITKSIKKVYDQLGFEQKTNEKRLDTYNRAKVLAWACKYGHGDCTKNATELFNKYREKESEKVPKNIRSAVYCSAIREASDNVNYKFLIEKFEKSKIATETTLILASLGCVKSDELIKKYYEYILDNKVRKQDKSSAMTSLFTENPESPEKVFDLIVEDHEKLGKAFGNGDSDVASVLSSIASRFTNEDQKKKLEAFIEGKGSKLSEAAKESLNKAVKTAEKNLKWTSEYLNGLLSAMRGGAAEKSFSIFLLALTLILCSTFVR